jgi:hypothetical protein
MSQANIKDLIGQFAGQYNTLTIQRPYIEFAGSVEGGLFLSQLLYWADRAREDGWFYKSYQEWRSEIYVPEKQVRGWARKFIELGFLETANRRAPNGNTVIHYRLDWEAFTQVFASFLSGSADRERPFGRSGTDDLSDRERPFGRSGTDDLSGPTIYTSTTTSTTSSTTASKSSAEKRMKVDSVLKVEVVQEQIAIPLPVKEEEPTTEQTTKDQGAAVAIVPAKVTKTACDRQTHALVCTARQDEDYKSFKRFYERISNVVGGNIGNGQAAEEEWMILRGEGYEIGPALWDGLDAFKAITIAKFRAEGKVVGFQGMRNFIRDRGWESALEAQTMRAEIEASGFKPEGEKSKFQKLAEGNASVWEKVQAKMRTGELK